MIGNDGIACRLRVGGSGLIHAAGEHPPLISHLREWLAAHLIGSTAMIFRDQIKNQVLLLIIMLASAIRTSESVSTTHLTCD